MATEYSFDVVSKVDLTEVKNAVDQTEKEISTRFDFRGTVSEIKIEESTLKLTSDDEFKLEQLIEILRTRMAKRGVSLKALEYGKIEQGTKGTVRQTITLKQGIPTEEAKRVTRDIRASGIKVTAQIQNEQIRITGKDKDALQAVQKLIRSMEDLPFDVDFSNYR
jgi:uncharacterized protein YajQ (UPF0234 family)